MGLLLDTHVVIWWFADDSSLPHGIRDKLEAYSDEIFVSSVSAFEMATKHRIGKLPHVAPLLDDYGAHLRGQGFAELGVTAAHGLKAGALAFDHRDPFDRLLIAQAMIEGLSLVSNERRFDETGVSRLWD